MDNFDENKLTCAQSVPFAGEVLRPDYAKVFGSQAFMGLEDAALWCQSPYHIEAKIFESLSTDPDYSCPIEKMPFDYTDWDPKWFSHVCREWYQN